ncbi:leucyl-tRNA synthetase [Capnocytophaga ochracea DSM 7271]|uniref:Leucine--tRNA ligase n=1 Tax=Capnocytophaga ochracea (strain ATCC 27872 / DSM 7271 / CCUG 9716 / JCM 12966 / NCTC 12371 / SS31 / VPI 2845) TaxID=521097 RepID=C7M3G0_CAPOD|nr:class I tRNA ligase family protein [Capnocytophaga ochracea]ACU92507.1 leucyl-tRNA synthetase [Capnocytophaga ochracea DSM 7271]UAK51239.1 class I tRNA ligase family protein [Capnocytophaga ochracea]
MVYNHKEIEAFWQEYWAKHQTFKAQNNSTKPKYYVLDMFPYPSGAGLHVGHPLGYIASDIVARYKRHKGFNVLHPQGYDSFGLPAEQYAIQTGQHPALTTAQNIARYREQLDKMGFSFDWSREVKTSDPDYYRHTQWIFIQLFNSWYNNATNKAEPIETLIALFETEGNSKVNAACDDDTPTFTAAQWHAMTAESKQRHLLKYRLTYLAETEVNWCPALGTVLANDEIVNGVSERGGHPVIRKKMTQWSMRITAYAERLLQGLDTIDWSESIKESQRNWIGKSVGASIDFMLSPLSPEGGKSANAADETIDMVSEVISDGKFGYMTSGDNFHFLEQKAKEMRENMTESETVLWEALKSKHIGDKFRRQHIIGNFIADFVCLSKRLVIEVDGGYHTDDTQQGLDEGRAEELKQLGFEVIRFTNEEVLNNLDKVIHQITEKLSFLPNQKELSKVTASASSITTEACPPSGVREPIKGSTIAIASGSTITIEACPPSGERGLITVFTTRPDTLFGVTYLTLAPEHPLVLQITTEEQRAEVEAYIAATAKRSERDRMADTKTVSGAFTGAYALHPLTGKQIPIWIGDYVLASYGTGAVMAVPAGDDRDYAFAKHFKGTKGMPEMINIFDKDISENAFTDKEGMTYQNSDFLNGCNNFDEAVDKVLAALEARGAGKAKVNYRLRDAVFSRQRYWGEPFPVYYKNGLPQMIGEEHLPILLPEVEKYLPTEEGNPPLGNATTWAWDTANHKVVNNDLIDNQTVFPLELNTMPGWAGSSWYWLEYMMEKDARGTFPTKAVVDYWQNVDLYVGGSEHATGHLLYSRFWNKFLKDRGFAPTEEPFKKLINQGMILGMSAFAYRLEGTNTFVSKNQIKGQSVQPIHVDVSLLKDTSDELDIEKFKAWRKEFANAEFILEEDGKYITGREVEKMSKSKYNVVNPDDICEQYGADTLRLYEMFLGPLEQAKPWNTAGISGVYNFLRKLWRLYFNDNGWQVTDEAPTPEMLKALHKTIKKVNEDIENFSFNTSVSQFMICVNELSTLKCHHRDILAPLAVLVAPFAPHISEELWKRLGNTESITYAPYPVHEDKYLQEDSKEYPVSFNGKVRFKRAFATTMTPAEIEQAILSDPQTAEQLQGNIPKKVIVVPNRIINIVM